MISHPNHGGRRRGAGRPPTDPATHFIKRTHTFRPETLRILEQLAREGDTTKSAILETAIRRLAAQEGER